MGQVATSTWQSCWSCDWILLTKSVYNKEKKEKSSLKLTRIYLIFHIPLHLMQSRTRAFGHEHGKTHSACTHNLVFRRSSHSYSQTFFTQTIAKRGWLKYTSGFRIFLYAIFCMQFFMKIFSLITRQVKSNSNKLLFGSFVVHVNGLNEH